MDDKATAAKIIDDHYESGRNFMYAAIVAALEAARREGAKQVVDEAEKVSQILKGSVPVDAESDTVSSGGYQGGYNDGFEAGLDHLREAVSLRGIIDCTGEVPCVRRVLGTLPVTADGCVAMPGALVWHPDSVSTHASSVYGFNECEVCVVESFGPDGFVDKSKAATVAECYSTESAAKAAMEGGKA